MFIPLLPLNVESLRERIGNAIADICLIYYIMSWKRALAFLSCNGWKLHWSPVVTKTQCVWLYDHDMSFAVYHVSMFLHCITLQHPVALCVLTSCSQSSLSLCSFINILIFTHFRLFVIQHYMFRPNWPSSDVQDFGLKEPAAAFCFSFWCNASKNFRLY
jgi:hypothetical protein